MFVQRIPKKVKGKTYYTTYITHNKRVNGKIIHEYLSNISNLPESTILNIQSLLKKNDLVSVEDLLFHQGKSIGAIYCIKKIADELGISKALGDSDNAKLALLQIACRIISQGSRNYLANEWINNQAYQDVFKIHNVSEDLLLDNLAWLCENKNDIEDKIFKSKHNNTSGKTLFLYDVTSTYLEGTQNELAEFGYNRDKKKGKMQIVIGLLTNDKGYPVSIEAFKGNTNDTKTVKNQLIKLRKRFAVEKVVLVGDKGMIKSAQIRDIQSEEFQWNYITSITKEQIKTLIKKDVIQYELFDNELVDISDADGTRYILRRNPIRAKEIYTSRMSRINRLNEFVINQNIYLDEHPRAKVETAIKKVELKILKHKFSSFIKCRIMEGKIFLDVDSKQLKEQQKFDGCYAIKTDLTQEEMDTDTVHARYKDLAQVEQAFRTMKNIGENIRPVFVRKKESTIGHIFVVMLGYMIMKYMQDKLKHLPYTMKGVIESLDKIQYIKYTFGEKTKIILPDELLKQTQEILDGLNIKLNCSLENN